MQKKRHLFLDGIKNRSNSNNQKKQRKAKHIIISLYLNQKQNLLTAKNVFYISSRIPLKSFPCDFTDKIGPHPGKTNSEGLSLAICQSYQIVKRIFTLKLIILKNSCTFDFHIKIEG